MSLNIDTFIISCESMMITEEDYACEAFSDTIKKLGGKIAGVKDKPSVDDNKKLTDEDIATEKEIYEKAKSFFDNEFARIVSSKPKSEGKKEETIKAWEKYRLSLAKYLNAGVKLNAATVNMKSEYKEKTYSIGTKMINEYKMSNMVIEKLKTADKLYKDMNREYSKKIKEMEEIASHRIGEFKNSNEMADSNTSKNKSA